MAQQSKVPDKSTRLQCCWVNGAHLNLNGAMGPARTWLSRAAVLGSWPQSKVGAEGQLQSKRRVQPVWPSTPGATCGLSSAGGCGVLLLSLLCLLASAVGFAGGCCLSRADQMRPGAPAVKGSRRPTVTL